MAVVTWPLSSGEARGRVGGLIYNTHRGKTYVKTQALHQGEFTQPQIDARAYTAVVTAAWQALDSDLHDAWTLYANEHTLSHWTGQQKRLSGYNWFVILNWFRALQQVALLTVPPTYNTTYTILNPSVTPPSPAIQFNWTPQHPQPDLEHWVFLRLEGPYPGPRTANIKRAQTIHYVTDSTTHLTWIDPDPGFYFVHYRTLDLNAGYSIWQYIPTQVI